MPAVAMRRSERAYIRPAAVAMNRGDAVSDRVDDFGDQLPGFQVFPGRAVNTSKPPPAWPRVRRRPAAWRVGQVRQWRHSPAIAPKWIR
jgi:hypothetical protein